MLVNLAARFSRRSRLRRASILKYYFPNLKDLKIVDLGGGDGRHIKMILPDHHRITVADLNANDLKEAAKLGYKTILFDGIDKLPLNSDDVDLIFCSSVIEHVTLPKGQIWTVKNDVEFESTARQSQLQFAREIVRSCKGYFVQTPYKYFIIESHTWLPGAILLLPRPWLVRLIRFTNLFWPKRTSPDWRLLTAKDMHELFPDAEIVIERVWGLPKSIIAIRKIS